MIAKLYRKIVPEKVRNVIYELFLDNLLKDLRGINKRERKVRKDLIQFYDKKGFDEYSTEHLKATNWIKKNGYSIFPYDFTLSYNYNNISVFKCKESGFNYVIHNNKKLYLPNDFSILQCKQYYNGLLIEQDIQSPHYYNTSCLKEKENWTILDVGAAEGIFSLDIIENVDKVYLFECEEKWIKALEMTFKPYSDKVIIVNKYISNIDDNKQMISIDSFMRDKSFQNCYIKMDIEGAELLALKGASNLIKDKKNINLCVCLYHNENDQKEITDFLLKYNYKYSINPGLMLFSDKPPFFRSGIVFAQSNMK